MANFYGQYVGFGAGGAAAPFVFGGTNYGYCCGGFAPSGPYGYNQDWIQKTSFSSDLNATNIGALTVPSWGGAGIGNNVHGYCCGGYNHPSGPTNEICRWSFSGDGDASEVGDLSLARSYPFATSDKATYGYVHGGQSPPYSDVIDRFSFASGTEDAGDVGDLTTPKSWGAGTSTESHGYLAGGWTGSRVTVIERYAFAESSDAAAIGTLASVAGGHGTSGVTSTTHGYFCRLDAGNPTDGDIQKYAFAASSDAANVGDIQVGNVYKTGASSTTHGYLMGGSASVTDAVEKFSLSVDGDSVEIADLAFGAQEGMAGTEY